MARGLSKEGKEGWSKETFPSEARTERRERVNNPPPHSLLPNISAPANWKPGALSNILETRQDSPSPPPSKRYRTRPSRAFGLTQTSSRHGHRPNRSCWTKCPNVDRGSRDRPVWKFGLCLLFGMGTYQSGAFPVTLIKGRFLPYTMPAQTPDPPPPPPVPPPHAPPHPSPLLPSLTQTPTQNGWHAPCPGTGTEEVARRRIGYRSLLHLPPYPIHLTHSQPPDLQVVKRGLSTTPAPCSPRPPARTRRTGGRSATTRRPAASCTSSTGHRTSPRSTTPP